MGSKPLLRFAALSLIVCFVADTAPCAGLLHSSFRDSHPLQTERFGEQALSAILLSKFSKPFLHKKVPNPVRLLEAQEADMTRSSDHKSVVRHSPFKDGLNDHDVAELAGQYLSSGSTPWENGWTRGFLLRFDQQALGGWYPSGWRFRQYLIIPLLEALNKRVLKLSPSERVIVQIHWTNGLRFTSSDGLRTGDGFIWEEKKKEFKTLHIFAAALDKEDVRSIVLHQLTATIMMNLFGPEEPIRILVNFVAIMMERIEGADEVRVPRGETIVRSFLARRFLHREMRNASDQQLRKFVSETESKQEAMKQIIQRLRVRVLRNIPAHDSNELLDFFREEYNDMSLVLNDLVANEIIVRAALRAKADRAA
jgi:hypothetical protein